MADEGGEPRDDEVARFELVHALAAPPPNAWVYTSLEARGHIAVGSALSYPPPSLAQGLLQELCQSHDNGHLAELADQVLALLEQLPTFDPGNRDEQMVAMQLHTAGITLWNRGVALKSAGAIPLTLNAQSEPTRGTQGS